MNSCVVKNRDFYSLAEEHGIDGNELELIVHKYWNEVGKEDSFPPSSYINEQLGIGKKYEETGKAVRQLWEKLYSKPIRYKSQMELNAAVEEAKKYFPAEAIVTYKDNNGNYVLRVIEPYNEALAKEAVEREMKGIKQKAQDDGTFMKAPNGKDTKLTERQWLQVRTKAFKGWFGDWENDPKNASKVVDENGEPLVVYHGSPEVFDTFNFEGDRSEIGGFFLTSDKDYAKRIVELKIKSKISNLESNPEKSNSASIHIMPVFLNIKEPNIYKEPLYSEVVQDVKDSNMHDGIIGHDADTFNPEGLIPSNGIEFVVFKANQIKSATGNNGEFSMVDDNIYHDESTQESVSREKRITTKTVGYNEVQTKLGEYIDSIDKTGEFGKALDEFVTEYGIDGINTLITGMIDSGHSGSWNNVTRTLKLFFANNATHEERAAVLLHELYHLKTVDLAKLYEQYRGIRTLKYKGKQKLPINRLTSESLTPEVIKAFDTLVECKAEVIKYLEEHPNLKDSLMSMSVSDNLNKRALYALLTSTNKYDVKEFISEIFTNPAFIKLLESIPVKTEKKTFWDKVKDVLKHIFGNNKPVVSILDRARQNAEAIIRANKKVDAAFKTISEDITQQPLHRQRGQLINYYSEMTTLSEKDYKQAKALLKYLADAITVQADDVYGLDFTQIEGKVELEIEKIIRDKHIDPSIIKVARGFRAPGSYTAVARITFKSYSDYRTAKRQEAENYVFSLKKEKVEEEVWRLANEEMFDSTHSFTYSDGTVINTPFELNDQQKAALQKIDDFCKSDAPAITLSGYAGTGKTSLMEMVANKMSQDWNRRVVFCATTHQAAGVLRVRVNSLGYATKTVHSLFGIRIETDLEGSNYNARNKVKNYGSCKILPGDVVIIDESSMLSDDNYDDVVRMAKGARAKVIFVGDEAQCAPVGQKEISKVFRNNNGEVVKLTKVERTGDNAILKEATSIRDGKEFSYESSFNKDGKGVAFVHPNNMGTVYDVIDKLAAGLRTNPYFLKIITFTNDAVERFNEAVRASLGYRGAEPQIGEIMTGYQNWGYDNTLAQLGGDPYKFVNSRVYRVVSKGRREKRYLRLDSGEILTFDVFDLSLCDNEKNNVTIPYIDVKNNNQNREATVKAAKEKASLWTKWKSTTDKEVKKACLNKINEIENFLVVNATIPGESGNVLQFKVIDFGYASTIHKSQGSTYTHVILDDSGIEASQNSESDKQKLKYVGVTRATDTVTIISNKTKSEDSPIEHIQGTPEEANETNIAAPRPQNDSVKTINIWASSEENAHLSNFAERPFTHTWSNGKITKFRSVEQAFQFAKAAMAKDREIAQKILNITEGAELRKLGKSVKCLNIAEWNKYKSSYMKAFIKESFMQNPNALTKLEETGDATLTHIQDKGEWGKRFPEILMQVREELRNYTPSTESSHGIQEHLAEQISTESGTTDMLPLVSATDVDTTTPINQIPDPNPDGPLKGFTLHSGGAIGADFAWAEIGASYGVEGKHYYDATDAREGKKPPYANTPITDAERTEGADKALYAGKVMGRLEAKAQKVVDPLVIRDWMQIKHSSMVVAIAQKFDNTGDRFSNNPSDSRTALIPQVSGGTGWAVQMAISEGIPVYVFNQSNGKWYVNFCGQWKHSEAPILKENFTGIGTRNINDAGRAAIKECYEKTVEDLNKATSTVEEATESKKSFDKNSLSPEMQAEFDRLTRRSTQINNILSSDVITSTEAREIVDDLMCLVSDYITEVMNDPALSNNTLRTRDPEAYLKSLLVNKNFEGAITPFNPSGLTRREVINKIGVDNLMNIFIKSKLTPNGNMTRKQIKKMQVLASNLDAILYLGANTLSINEGIHLTTARVNGHEVKSMDEGIVINSDLNSARDAESVQENEGSLQEKWQIDSRTEDVLESMSQIVRNTLFQMYQLDSNGNKIISSMGINKRLPVQETTKQLLSWLQGSLTLTDMVAKLKTKESSNPWVKQLIAKLENTDGTYTDFQNSFFSVFNKHFQSYSATIVTYDSDGTQHIKRVPLNDKPFMKATISHMQADIAVGIHPMFKPNGVDKQAFASLTTVRDTLHKIKDDKISRYGFNKLNAQDKALALEAVRQAASLLGYPVDKNTLDSLLTGKDIVKMITYLDNMYDNILANVNNPNYDPLSYNKEDNEQKSGGIRGSMTKFLEPLTRHLQDITVNTVFDNGKMYQSHVIPSYMTKLALKFHEEDQAKFDEFIQNEFGQYDWFKGPSGWRSGWLSRLVKDPEARKVFKHEAKLNYNKHNYMKNMTGNEYILSLLSSFFSEGAGKGKKDAKAWYRIPILSNKPSEEYIRFYAEMGADFKDAIADKMLEVFNQELSRIQTVRMQNYDKSDPRFIKNFHTNGKRFCFLDFLNVYLEDSNSELGKLIQEKLESSNWDSSKEVELMSLAKQAIEDAMEAKVQSIIENYEKRGILEAAKSIEGINDGFGKDNIKENIERFLWNDSYAATQIMELTVTDIAYYKDMEDLQKRIAQIHSPGVRGNAEAVDYTGARVSDGYERTMYLTDFAGVVSNIKSNVKIVFDRKLEELKAKPLDDFLGRKPETEEDLAKAEEIKDSRIAAQKALYESILKQYDDINVADAQGYSSPTSYRKKMFIFGKWSKEAESVYQKLISGEFNYADLKVAFQPLKPFVYSQIPKSTGLDAGPMRNIKMPVQNKNSEYLLILADAILQNEDTGQPNLLRAIYEVMEESAKVSPTKGIDTIQFESTVKSGLMGRNDINRVLSEEGNWRELVETTVNGKTVKRTRGEIAAKAFLQSHLYSKNAEGNVTGYNSIYVHELPFEDYCIQQEVPIHFKEHEQQHGSQIRMIIPSDLATEDSFGNKVTYEVEGKQLRAEEFRAEYERTIAQNIAESIKELSEELHLDAANNVEKNIVISRMLQDEILSSPRYGLDMYLACSLDPTTGEFRIPLGDPIQANRIEQLLNSIIKKRVNEQKLPGGPVVQVSNFGTSRKLNIRFKDKTKEDALLMTREEFEKTWKPETPMENNKQNLVKLANQLMKEEKLSYSVALKEAQNRLSNPSEAKTVDEAYTEYIKTNQGGIDHFEVFAPIFSDEIFDRFADADGNIDIKAMQEVCPEALQMIGYRIPTEDKYSCAPIKIVGFLPREAGEGIMLPYDITLLTGSDFDVDKEYLMRKQVNIGLKSFKEQYDLLSPYFLELKKKESGLKRDFTKEELANYKAELTDMIDMFRSNKSRRNYRKEAGASTIEKQMWDKFKRVGYNITKASEGRTYRNNKIFDMSWTVLTHETTSDKILNPGGFEEQKRDAYMMEAYKNSDKSWEELQTMSTKELKALSYNTKNLIFLDSQVQFYEQNNAASTILGMFAVQKIAHATLESNGYKIDVQEVCGLSEPFTILGMTFEGQMEIDKMYDKEGNVIGKTLGSHVAAAADAAKEPCLNLLNINSQTANVHSTLIRLGMPFKDAALFLGQPVIREILDTYNKKNIDDYASLDSVISDYLKDFIENGSMYDSKIEHEDITREELIHNVKERRPETDYKIVRAFSRLQQIADALKGPTYITRFNSISNAVGPLITDNMVTEYKTQFSSIGLYTKEGNALDADKILQDHPVLRLFNAAYAKANEIFADFPSCSEAFRNVLQEAPFILQDKFYKDREMLNDLKDFFLSHLLIDKNVVNEAKAKYYIKDYAKEFATNNIKAKYPDNEFIQAINIKIDSDTKEYTLELSTTGMDQAKKDRLSSFWFELYKQNSKLALDLFNYNFFRGGIGFTPKTFMNLLPLQIREVIPGYKECFADMSSYSYTSKYILEQYLAHNTSNNKLFPTKECKKEITGGGIIISGSETADYTNVATFKFQDAKKKWRYMMLEKIGDDGFVYKEILPLGDNGSYLEMSSLSMPQVSLKEIYGTKKKSKQLEPKQSEVTTQSNQPVEDTSTGQTYKTPGEEKSYAEALIKGMIQEYPGITNREAAKNTLLGMKNGVVDIHNSVVQKYIKAAVESQGLKYDENKLQEELDKLC